MEGRKRKASPNHRQAEMRPGGGSADSLKALAKLVADTAPEPKPEESAERDDGEGGDK